LESSQLGNPLPRLEILLRSDHFADVEKDSGQKFGIEEIGNKGA
jgi:hypothetical protein